MLQFGLTRARVTSLLHWREALQQRFVMRLQAKLLSPAAEAFRYFIIERGEAHLLAHDEPLLQRPQPGA